MKIKINIREIFFFLAYIPLLMCAFYDTTTFKAVVSINTLYVIVRLFALCVIAYKCVAIDRYSQKTLIIIALFVLFSALSILRSSRVALFEYVLLMVGARGIAPKKIVKSFFTISLVMIITAFAFSKLGLIVDYTIIRRGSSFVRHSFGIVYTTDFAAHVFFTLLSFLFIKRKRISLIQIIGILGLIVWIDRNCNARISEALMVITLLLYVLYDFKASLFEWKVFQYIVKFSGFFFSACVFALAIAYNTSNSLMVLIDENCFNGRFFVAKKVIDLYGISLFGQKIMMQGDGFKTYTYDASLGTTYIDSAYLQIGLLYGIVILLFILIFISKYVNVCIERKETKLVIAIFLILLSCVYNQYLLFIAYNPFMIAMGSYVLQRERGD